MTCVWRAETAACRAARLAAGLAAGLPGGDAPDESECRSSCANLAHRPRHRRPARARRPPGGCGGGPAVPGAAAGPRRGPGRPRPGRHRPSRPQPRRGYGTRTGGSHVSRAARRDRDAERAAIRAQPGACWPGPPPLDDGEADRNRADHRVRAAPRRRLRRPQGPRRGIPGPGQSPAVHPARRPGPGGRAR
jgi:hypothetical protein